MRRKHLCYKCSKMIVCQAFTTTNCSICNAKITTGHMPGYEVCPECAADLNLCMQCGKELKEIKRAIAPTFCLNNCGRTTCNTDGICNVCARNLVDRDNKYGKDEDVEI